MSKTHRGLCLPDLSFLKHREHHLIQTSLERRNFVDTAGCTGRSTILNVVVNSSVDAQPF